MLACCSSREHPLDHEEEGLRGRRACYRCVAIAYISASMSKYRTCSHESTTWCTQGCRGPCTPCGCSWQTFTRCHTSKKMSGSSMSAMLKSMVGPACALSLYPCLHHQYRLCHAGDCLSTPERYDSNRSDSRQQLRAHALIAVVPRMLEDEVGFISVFHVLALLPPGPIPDADTPGCCMPWVVVPTCVATPAEVPKGKKGARP